MTDSSQPRSNRTKRSTSIPQNCSHWNAFSEEMALVGEEGVEAEEANNEAEEVAEAEGEEADSGVAAGEDSEEAVV